MHFKLDENLPSDAVEPFHQNGYEASTVRDQDLAGVSDETIARKCKHIGQVIVTLDLDFSDIRIYPPSEYAGIIVLRLKQQGHDALMEIIIRIISLLEKETLDGRLWVIDEHRLRIRE